MTTTDNRRLCDIPESELPLGVYRDAAGHYQRVKVGAGNKYVAQWRPPAEYTVAQALAWRARERQRLVDQRDKDRDGQPKRGTLEADVAQYLADAELTPTTKKRRTQQLAWWCAQPAPLKAPPIAVEALKADPARGRRADRLGLLPRRSLDAQRIRELLRVAFAPTDAETDPTEFANTSNHYRTALLHLFTVLDQDDKDAVNPVRRVKIRPTQGAQPHALDMRVVVEILKHLPSRFGRSGLVTVLRTQVLAWVHITPVELRRVRPDRDFHDVPDATRADVLDGAITLSIPPRHKGRLHKIPAPQVLPLNPWGVTAVRLFAAEPAAWGPKISGSSLNKAFKRACRRAQAALAARGIVVDLSETTIYHLKHSLTTAAQLASPGVFDRQGRVQPAPGVQASLSHQQGRTTRFYTEAAVNPLVRLANANTTRYLEALFAQPLKPATPLRLVAAGESPANA